MNRCMPIRKCRCVHGYILLPFDSDSRTLLHQSCSNHSCRPGCNSFTVSQYSRRTNFHTLPFFCCLLGQMLLHTNTLPAQVPQLCMNSCPGGYVKCFIEGANRFRDSSSCVRGGVGTLSWGSAADVNHVLASCAAVPARLYLHL